MKILGGILVTFLVAAIFTLASAVVDVELLKAENIAIKHELYTFQKDIKTDINTIQKDIKAILGKL